MKALCTRHCDGGRPSRSVWCSHMSAAPAERNQVRTRCQRMTAPALRRKKAQNPLLGVVCLLTTGVLISVRLVTPFHGRATGRNCSVFPGGRRSRPVSSSLEGARPGTASRVASPCPQGGWAGHTMRRRRPPDPRVVWVGVVLDALCLGCWPSWVSWPRRFASWTAME